MGLQSLSHFKNLLRGRKQFWMIFHCYGIIVRKRRNQAPPHGGRTFGRAKIRTLTLKWGLSMKKSLLDYHIRLVRH